MHLADINADNKEKIDFFTTHPIFSLVSLAHFQTIYNGKVKLYFKYNGLSTI